MVQKISQDICAGISTTSQTTPESNWWLP